MPETTDLNGLLVACVQDLYDAERRAIAAHPPYRAAVSDAALRNALDAHYAETEAQEKRMERAAQLLGIAAQGPENIAVQGLLADGERDMTMIAPGALLDLALIGALQKVEGMEQASYNTAIRVAHRLGQAEIVALLTATLAEENAANERLAACADDIITRAN